MNPSISLLLWPLLASIVASTSVYETAKYDVGLPNPPASVILESGVGTYQGLYYNSWRLTGGGLAGTSTGVSYLITESSPHYLITSEIEQSTNGTPSMSVVSPYTSFNLLDFYFGCTIRTTAPGAAIAIPCTVTVAGFAQWGGQEVAVANYTFDPPLLENVTMMHAVLPDDFQDLVNVTLIQDVPLLQGLDIDNFSYELNE